MSSEASLSDAPNVVSRLHNLRLNQEDGDEPQQNVNLAGSGDSSPELVRNTQPVGNVMLSRVRRAFNYVWDEDQPTSSTARSGESSFLNGDKPPTNAANTLHLEGRSQNNIALENTSTNSQATVAYNWQGTKATMRERIVFLFNNEILSDVSFIVGRGTQKQRIPAHKLVLSSGSAVFDAMFNGTLATTSSEIEVPDVEPVAFLAVLLFLYTDKIEIDPESVMMTLYTAKKYAVSALEKHCVDYLKSNLTRDNAFLLLTQARLFDEPQLAAVCLDTIDRFTTEALNADGFTDIDIDTLKIVLERDTLRVTELKIFQAVLRWSEAECSRHQLPVTPENQRLVLGTAFSLVRFPLMSKEEFTAGPAQSGLLNYSEVLSLFSYFILNPKPVVGFQTMPRCCMTGKEQTVCRFQHTKSRWGYNGTSDRIRFSVDRRIFLIGYGVYGSMQGPAIYEVLIELIHTASGKIIATNSTSFSCDGSKYTYRLMFKELAEILPNTIYTASATFKGPYSHYGTKGLKTVMVDSDTGNGKVKFEFSMEAGDNNGTSTDEGQIPELIFYT
ncbi:BTB/POZ domain-containing protein 1-like isoform X2 [Hylaeus anthracinus]|uniref:BTB/POZ domain-containing protein 1-like isoform X2 n=1 Tax=Hylaeus volcanicus TaxID=313075 RepID=UPI0023B85E24|nr:BTB/POZ domain-containing protein 1-like isoform X2 [Hylaeus volcanicus]XP_054004594.1 BTB/POZ domain-containing protein 1-like isoform X2 [Hylaeus anthracinus]